VKNRLCDPADIRRRGGLARSAGRKQEASNVKFLRREHAVTVHETPCTLIVYQRSRSVWVAVGFYMDERIEIRDSRESTAIKRWIDEAMVKGSR
jgi:hypothetical protein